MGIPAEEREVLTTISPTTNQPIVTRHGLNSTELYALGNRAREAQARLRKLSLSERQDIVTKALASLRDSKDVLGQDLTKEMGRPIASTPGEIDTAVKRGEYCLKISSAAMSDTPGDEQLGFRRYIRKEPVGVVLIVFAWNYPYLILMNSLIPALLAGNAVVLKPSPQTPTVAEHIQRIFVAAGLPQDVIQYFHCGSSEQLESFIRSGNVDMVSFTGSVAGGRAVEKMASGVLIPVCLELGGKDPAYVRADADIPKAAEAIVDGAIYNSGQSCCSVERVYVHDSVHDDLVAAMKDVLREHRVGDPLDKDTTLGPVISKKALESIHRHLADALSRGASDATPKHPSFERLPSEGNFIAPRLLIDVKQDMEVMQEETFGPIIPVMRVPDDAEAIRVMNDCKYGLTASIWTKDIAGAEEMVDKIVAGTVFINRCDYPSPDLAWSGRKLSGKGVTLSRFGFEQFLKFKSIHIKESLGET